MNLKKRLFSFACSLFLASGVLSAQTVYEIDFSKASGKAESWFKSQGWEFKEDMGDMNPRFEGGRFVVEPKDDELGVIVRQLEGGDQLSGVQRLRIEWGVDQYPAGADWSGPKDKTRNTREPISLMVFFGEDKIDSGSTFVPNLPYFMSFFLGEKERPGQAYYGNYWQKGGRYFCIPCDGSTGKTLVTDVNLPELFKQEFGKAMPAISGLTIEIDVQKTEKSNGRHAKAFIQKIQLLK
ncbi:MAG: hypothetical protein ACO4AU_02920 [bacterium]|jgi:hypothetical protein